MGHPQLFLVVMLQPGDCSPSRKVVSKKKTRSGLLCSLGKSVIHGSAAFRILLIIIFQDSHA